MTIRSTIILLAVPLFLLLALVNGGLLYFQQRAGMEQALSDQALAAAVTIAEFVSEMDDPQTELAQPARRQAIGRALRHVEGIGGVYLLKNGREPLPVQPANSPWDFSGLDLPARPTSIGPYGSEASGRWVTAMAPAGQGQVIAARISAEPIYLRMDRIRRDIVIIVLLSGLFAAALGWFVAWRIGRELRINHQALTLGSEASAEENGRELQIREARDLAEAVKLMESSRAAADAREQLVLARMQKMRDADRAVDETRTALFAPCEFRDHDVEIAMQICGDAPAGCFFAYAGSSDCASIVIGQVSGESPIDELAGAVQIRRLLESSDGGDDFARTLKLVRALYCVEALQIHAVEHASNPEAELQLICLTDTETATRAKVYRNCNAPLAPGKFLEGLSVMLEPDGVFVSWRMAKSADCGQGRLNIRFDHEDGAEAADVKDFAH